MPGIGNIVSATDTDVLIVGGGPIGLLLANLLGYRGVRSIVLERRTEPLMEAMAIGIMPPSLEILRRLGLDTAFARDGLMVTTAVVHENRKRIGALTFHAIPGSYQFVLSLPQTQTVQLLRDNLVRFPSVIQRDGTELVSLRQDDKRVTADVRDVLTGAPSEVSARFLVGCDGYRSEVRTQVGVQTREKRYRQRYVMSEFADSSGFADVAHIFMGPQGCIESFPMPGGLRRWIVLLPSEDPADLESYVTTKVKELAGYDLSGQPCLFIRAFGVRRVLARRYSSGRVVLCGDAAHVMSPVGGQGMNVGFGDANLLASILDKLLRDDRSPGEAFAMYETARRRACKVAANRAAWWMWLATRPGHLASGLRTIYLRHVMFSPRFGRSFAADFAMLTLPPNPPIAPEFLA